MDYFEHNFYFSFALSRSFARLMHDRCGGDGDGDGGVNVKGVVEVDMSMLCNAVGMYAHVMTDCV